MAKKTKYGKQFKLEVIEKVLDGTYTKEEARRKYGIKGKSAILYWIRKYIGKETIRKPDKEEIDTFATMKKILELAELKAKVKQLEEEKRLAEQRADLWETMVTVAEERLKIDIRKKSGVQALRSIEKRNHEQK